MIWWFAQNTLIAGLLAWLVWLICRVRPPSPALRHALWLVVLLKLVTPPVVLWPWPLPELLRLKRPVSQFDSADPLVQSRSKWASIRNKEDTDGTERTGESTAVLLGVAHAPTVIVSVDGRALEQLGGNARALDSTHDTETAMPYDSRVASGAVPQAYKHVESRGSSVAVWFGSLVSRLWLFGSAASVLLHATRIVRFCRILARSSPAPAALIHQVSTSAAKLQVRAPQVLLVDEIQSPLIWCAIQPQLLWPACLMERLESHRWCGVIAHELAHLRRRDHWVGWLELVASCVCWWNPLFWYVRHQLRENAELACDALVVSVSPDGRRAYAESLIEVAQLVSQTWAPVPVLGVSTGARQTFQRRLTMILCESVPCKVSLRGLLVIGLLGLVALPSWSLAQVVTTPKSQPPAAVTDPNLAASEPALEDPTAGVLYASPPQPANVLSYPVAALPVAEQSASGDDRIDALERKLEAIVAEMKSLREGRSRRPLGEVAASPAQLAQPNAAVGAWPQLPMLAQVQRDRADGGTDSDVQILSRGTYKLPKAKAEALAAFLREHMKSPVEAKVEDDSLIVTAPPEAQTTIAQFIALSEGKQPTATGKMFLRQSSRPAQNVLQYGPLQRKPPAAQPALELPPATGPARQ